MRGSCGARCWRLRGGAGLRGVDTYMRRYVWPPIGSDRHVHLTDVAKIEGVHSVLTETRLAKPQGCVLMQAMRSLETMKRPSRRLQGGAVPQNFEGPEHRETAMLVEAR